MNWEVPCEDTQEPCNFLTGLRVTTNMPATFGSEVRNSCRTFFFNIDFRNRRVLGDSLALVCKVAVVIEQRCALVGRICCS